MSPRFTKPKYKKENLKKAQIVNERLFLMLLLTGQTQFKIHINYVCSQKQQCDFNG